MYVVYVGAFLVGGRCIVSNLFIFNFSHDSGCFDTSSQKFLLLRYEDQSDRGTNMSWVALNVVRRYFIIEHGLQPGHTAALQAIFYKISPLRSCSV